MKRLFVLLLALLLLAVPVAATSNLVQDDSGLMADHDVAKLEEIYSQYPSEYGFTPALVTTDSFGGLSVEEFTDAYYDVMAYPEDGILLLVSLEEGYWYILTNGECYRRISDGDIERISDELVPLIKNGQYYAAFLRFPELAAEIFVANEPQDYEDPNTQVAPAEPKKNYGKTIAICMLAGMAIGGIAVGVMASQMKTVRMQNTASDYVRPGSMQLTNSRDIYLYSHVTRTAKPKNTSSGGGHGGGGSRGGHGGRL